MHLRVRSLAVLILAIAVAATACSTAEVEPGPITSFEDIVGTTYERQGPGPQIYLQFFEDGTYHTSSSRDLVEERPETATATRFEGTKIFFEETKGFCRDNPDAIYEIHLLENGNVEFVAIEDPCAFRLGIWTVEWAPLP
jgi:hypothetical protein